MSTLDDIVNDDGTIYRRGKPICDAAAARQDLTRLRSDLAAARAVVAECLPHVEQVSSEWPDDAALAEFTAKVRAFAEGGK